MKSEKQKSSSPLTSLRPGSETKHVDLPHDFGAKPENLVETRYASAATRNQDRGHLQTRSNDESGGVRQSGVGTAGQSPGAGSGGDIDPDFVGLDGRGVAANIPDQTERQATNSNGSEPVAVDAPTNTKDLRLSATDDVPRGGTVTFERDEENDELDVEGADAIRTTHPNDPFADAAAGEISRGESAGPADSSSSSARH